MDVSLSQRLPTGRQSVTTAVVPPRSGGKHRSLHSTAGMNDVSAWVGHDYRQATKLKSLCDLWCYPFRCDNDLSHTGAAQDVAHREMNVFMNMRRSCRDENIQ